MAFQSSPNSIQWKLHLRSSPEQVFNLLSTNDGRALFWAESAMELDKHIHFVFPDGQKWRGKILEAKQDSLYSVEYLSGSKATFQLTNDDHGGTILTLTDEGVLPGDRTEVIAGWVSVLLALKAAADFDIDLRNHNAEYTWGTGFADS